MQRLTFNLVGVLAAQLVLALVLLLGGRGNGAFQAKEPLLALSPSAVDSIAIDESGGNSVTIEKKDGTWQLPAMAGFAADQSKVSTFLSDLGGLKRGWVTATTGDAAKRFKVTDDEHERRIVLSGGGQKVGEILLGTSPSFKQVHARVAGDSDIYNVPFATYQAASRPDGWMDRGVLNIADDKVASIAVNGVTIERKDGKYAMSNLAEGEKAKDGEVFKLASAATHPTFDVVQGKGADALAKVNDPDIQLSIKKTDGSTLTYKYKKEAAGGAYLFTRSDQDFLFRVAEASVETLVKAKRDALVETKKAAEAPEAQSATKPQDGQTGSGG